VRDTFRELAYHLQTLHICLCPNHVFSSSAGRTSDNFRPFNSSNCSPTLASIIIRYVPEYHNQHYLQATSEQALAQLPAGDMKEMPEMDQGMCTTLSLSGP
jgi:hypothetical protein